MWSLGDIPFPSLYSLCEDALGFTIPIDSDFKEHVDAMHIFHYHLTKKQRREIRDEPTSYVTVKRSEDRIIPRLSVEKSGQVRLHFDTWLHGKRILRKHIPTKAIYKAHKANQVSKIKRLLDNTNVSQEQIDSILEEQQHSNRSSAA